MGPGASAKARDKAALAWARPAKGDTGEDGATAAVAHGLLGNLAVIRGAARMLHSDHDLDAVERQNVMLLLNNQIDLMQGVLAGLVRGVPSQALAALDELGGR